MQRDFTAVVINLAHRTDRRREMEAELSRIGWQANFFRAIRPTDAAGFPSIGARGCYLSQLSVLREAQKANVNRLVLLEDDVNFVPDFTQRWEPAIAQLDSLDWSFFYPGHLLENLPPGISRVDPSTGIQCAHFVVINGSAIPTLVQGLEAIMARPAGHALGGPMHVDGAYSTLRWQNKHLTTYALNPVLGFQRPSRTDIGHMKWFDRVAALRPAVRLARRLRG